ncbi:MAG: response regulator [Candidatus Pacebacteria bacterium]|nr:response regulator [Candidatus Paceibacterota bacterium]
MSNDQQKGKTIFVVDDDKFLLDMYTVKFKEKGFNVIQAFGSTEALEKLRGGLNPDVILLDVVMPMIDGFELFGIIREEKLAADAKIVMLSNLSQSADIEKAKSLGAKGYIVKALAVPSEVVERVLVVLKGGQTFKDE